MTDKISRLAQKTGLGKNETKATLKLGFLGSILLALGALCACTQPQQEPQAPAGPELPPVPQMHIATQPVGGFSNSAQGENMNEEQPAVPTAAPAADVNAPANSAQPQQTSPDFWKNYPAGTKYNTASPKDFQNGK